MNFPKMILFDYDGTLIHSSGFDPHKGHIALFDFIKSNKNGHTPGHVNDFAKTLYKEVAATCVNGTELNQWEFYSQLYDYLQIEFSISHDEAEKVFWSNSFYCKVMPNADKMLEYINSKGIRSGIVSSLGCSRTGIKRAGQAPSAP